MYRTSDGQTFAWRDSAEWHAERLVNVERANELLSAGVSVADACRVAEAARQAVKREGE